MNKRTILYLITAVVLIAATYMVFTSPAIIPPISPELSSAEQENILRSYRIFYFHVPLAWVSYLAFFLVFIASIRYLQTSHVKWDVLSASSAEIGAVFCALNLLSGMLWAKGAWGIYWDWTPRLTFQLILFLLYVAYLTLRRAMGSESRARSSAVFGIIAFVAVPMSYLSIKLWPSLLQHPDLTSEGGGIDSPIIVYTLLINILAYTLLYLSLLTIRMDNERALAESASSRNP